MPISASTNQRSQEIALPEPVPSLRTIEKFSAPMQRVPATSRIFGPSIAPHDVPYSAFGESISKKVSPAPATRTTTTEDAAMEEKARAIALDSETFSECLTATSRNGRAPIQTPVAK